MKIFFIFPLLLLLLSCGVTTELQTNKAAPSDLQAVSTLNNQIQLNWKDNSFQELGFIISRRIGSSAFEIIDTTAVNSSRYFDADVLKDSLYTYRVAALFDDDISDWSNEAALIHKYFFGEVEFGQPETFDVITWNIQNFPKANQSTVDYLTFAILALDAEVIGLQEIESLYHFELLLQQINLLDTLNTWNGYRANSAAYEINLAYIYNSDQVEVINIYEIYRNDWYAFPRPPLVMECSFKNRLFYIINNHFKAFSGIENEARRRDASEKLDLYISENHAADNVIVLGDLNDDITEPQISNVFWVFISQPDEYLFADLEIALGAPGYWSYPGFPSHLDHILITNELFAAFTHENSDCSTLLLDSFLSGNWSEYYQNISDHRPVGMRLYLE